MFCLVYKSKANPALKPSQVRELLDKAREFNQSNKITGCLLFYNGQFIQYLEGNQIKVLELFDRIQKDTRHSNVELLSHEALEFREFEKWDMAFENLHGENSHLQYLKLLVDSFTDDNQTSLAPTPSSRKFWRTAKLILESKGDREKMRQL
jgi:hypothetical protein